MNKFLCDDLRKGCYTSCIRDQAETFVLADGSKYVGQFKNDTIEGEGWLKWTDGR
jgi:hypothetical protein